jgi:hypothetical protein
MRLPTNYDNLLIDRYSTGIQCTVGYTGACKLKSEHTVGYTGACKLKSDHTVGYTGVLWLIWCWFTGNKRIPHFMAVDRTTKRLPALSIWRDSPLFFFFFLYYSTWNIPTEHLHLCIPRCDQTLIYNHLCIPRCIVYPLIIYLSKGCHNLSVTTYLIP